MPAVAQIVLADALATPVNHTFIPLGQDSQGVWWYEDQSQLSPVGFWRISIQLVRAKNPAVGVSSQDRVSRVKVGLHEPVLETLSNAANGLTPAPIVAFISRTLTEYILPERGNLQNRKDLRKMSAALQSNAQVIAAVEDLQGIY